MTLLLYSQYKVVSIANIRVKIDIHPNQDLIFGSRKYSDTISLWPFGRFSQEDREEMAFHYPWELHTQDV
jgi:hypothetical protein